MAVWMRRCLGPVLVCSLALAIGTVSAEGDVQTSESIEYVALGDSYSAGVGAGNDDESGDCRRSANAYPRLWADAHDVSDFSFAACLGATTSDVLDQAEELDADTTLVTVSVGGNDAGFTDVMVDCTVGTDRYCLDRVEEAKTFARDTLPDRLETVYTTLAESAPNAEVLVFGYPRIYELNGSCSVGLSETKRSAINAGADALVESIAQQADEAGFPFLDVRERFGGHEICSSDWWLHSLTWPTEESYHPTAQGQELGYLPALEEVVSGDHSVVH